MTPARPAFLQPLPVTLVVAGGAVGTAARTLLEDAFPAAADGWPWATFLINLTGAFLLGVLLTTLAGMGPDEGRRRLVRLTLGTGLMGGFTTYSSFIIEVDQRLRGGTPALGVAYALLSITLGAALAFLGILAAGSRRHAGGAR